MTKVKNMPRHQQKAVMRKVRMEGTEGSAYTLQTPTGRYIEGSWDNEPMAKDSARKNLDKKKIGAKVVILKEEADVYQRVKPKTQKKPTSKKAKKHKKKKGWFNF